MKLDLPSQEFVEAMGMIYEGDGLPRIAGRILGLLTIQEGPFSLQELADVLMVSRGSISTNTRILEQFGMVDRVGKAGDRQGYYRLASDPYPRVLQGAVKRMEKARKTVAKAREAIPKTAKRAHKNLQTMEHFYTTTMEGLEDLARTLSKT